MKRGKQRTLTRPITFFETPAQQRLLITLAHFGPLRLQDALQTAGIYVSPPAADRLRKDRVIVRWQPHPQRSYVALNPLFPAADKLLTFLRTFPEPVRVSQTRCFQRESKVRPLRAGISAAEGLFGSRSRTKFLLALEAFDGYADTTQFQRLFCSESSYSIRVFMTKFEDAGMLRLGRSSVNRRRCVQWNSALPQMEAFREVLSALLCQMPQLKAAAAKVTRELQQPAPRPKARLIDWLADVEGVDLPSAWRAPEDSAPLLFGSDSKRRILAALLPGPLRAIDLERVSRARDVRCLLQLEHAGIVTRYRAGLKRMVSLAPSLPILPELRRLLLRFEATYPSCRRELQRYHDATHPPARTWTGSVEKLFGTSTRSLPLIMLGALGEADVSSLSRLLPQIERCTIARSLHMFRNLGVLTSRREGNAICYALNREFCAYSELASLLSAMRALLPVHASRAKMEELLMTPNRLTMRRNDRRRRELLQT